MRVLLLITLACACVVPEPLDESTGDLSTAEEEEEVIDDDHHCPGGDPGGGPGPKPDRKICTDQGKFPDVESCKVCCYYNHDHVDGWECRRIKNKVKRRRCWERAADVLGRCSAQCERDRSGVITTTTGTNGQP